MNLFMKGKERKRKPIALNAFMQESCMLLVPDRTIGIS